MNFEEIFGSNKDKKEIQGELVECPNCKHHFDSHDTFEWDLDANGHPTIEFLSCPKCGVATRPIFDCYYCPGARTCDLEEKCGATLYFSYNDWHVVNKLNNKCKL